MRDCFISKKERNDIIAVVNSMDLCDEDSVWDVAMGLESFSILLRSRVLEKSNSGGD